MAQQTLLLSSIFFFISLLPMFSCLDSPYYDNNNAYDSSAYLVDDGNSNLINLRTQVLRFKKIGETHSSSVFSVDDFDAKGDGTTDDTQAFSKAWKQACASPGAVFLVPENKTYLVKPHRFSGPCKQNLTIQISGTIEASDNRSDYKDRHWLTFQNIQNVLVTGGGTINGNGDIWWKNSCKINKSLPCKEAPTAVTFYQSKNLIVKNLNVKDAQQIQVSFQKCNQVSVSNLVVSAPGTSPNTDGIHVTETKNIQITKSTIGTGDDCISIVSGSQNVQVEDITCGPGHGISIGSLGADGEEAHVSKVTVNRAKLTGTTNGLRIKTWQGGKGEASNFKFENIEMSNVSNPIIIDQNYCDQDQPCKQQSSAVQVKNVVYNNVKGTSASKVAVKFDCSERYPCKGIRLQNVKLEAVEEIDEEGVEAECENVQVSQVGVVSPRCP